MQGRDHNPKPSGIENDRAWVTSPGQATKQDLENSSERSVLLTVLTSDWCHKGYQSLNASLEVIRSRHRDMLASKTPSFAIDTTILVRAYISFEADAISNTMELLMNVEFVQSSHSGYTGYISGRE